jgi:AbrB family looped-hinge helix DNA binding protein
MPFVTVKKKYQVVIPAAVRRQLRVEVGDLLEAKAERGKISLTPKSVIDRGIQESLEDFKAGRFYGPFENAEAMIASLQREVRKLHRARKPTRRKQ